MKWPPDLLRTKMIAIADDYRFWPPQSTMMDKNAWPRGENPSHARLRGSLYNAYTFMDIMIDVRQSDMYFKLHGAVGTDVRPDYDMGTPSKLSLLSLLGHSHMRTAEAIAKSTESG
ncbi:hypothetical protein HBH56_107570 [Parastagonospora nodorum]|nr:hypothetical protein HBH56_107570 [Parastagonospora nodorum]KAH3975666.1 hypothetical protein HBH52_129930 [Parastagonospora nodorum]KAH4188322.1 hypothetical protein HBI95_231570 [Parastagonospora nodorum]KAH4225503.1 hypothetical protein HBI05_227620 [Parastagonospora nodorum]KAH4320649.1 hypothetical protein HBI00_225410 [Parastagonospora nodorum]